MYMCVCTWVCRWVGVSWWASQWVSKRVSENQYHQFGESHAWSVSSCARDYNYTLLIMRSPTYTLMFIWSILQIMWSSIHYWSCDQLRIHIISVHISGHDMKKLIIVRGQHPLQHWTILRVWRATCPYSYFPLPTTETTCIWLIAIAWSLVWRYKTCWTLYKIPPFLIVFYYSWHLYHEHTTLMGLVGRRWVRRKV